MTDNKIHDVNWQKIKIQAINNENSMRLKWFRRNRDRLLKNLATGKSSKLVESKIESLKKDNELEKSKNELQGEEIKNIDQRSSASEKENIEVDFMRPVEPSVLETLYKQEKKYRNEATKSYLNKRYELRPKDKFYMPECSSWIYGWHIEEFPIESSAFRKKFIIFDDFYRKNTSSLNRDSDLSRNPQAEHPKNFNDLLTL